METLKRHQATLKKLLTLLTTLLSALGIAFVIWRLATNDLSQLQQFSIPRLAGIIGISAAIYLLSSFILALAWREVICWFSTTDPGFSRSLGIYGKTQISKYIPGNIFEPVNRYAAGMQAGLATAALVNASLYEIIIRVIIGGAFIIISQGFTAGQTDGSLGYIVVVLAGALAIGAGVFFAANWLKDRPRFAFLKLPQTLTLGRALPVLAYYTLFFITAGLSFYALIRLAFPNAGLSLPLVLSAFITSWLLGYIMPGAPAGAGVREVVLMAALAPHLGEAGSLLAALLGRMATVTGDLLFYLLAVNLELRDRRKNATK